MGDWSLPQAYRVVPDACLPHFLVTSESRVEACWDALRILWTWHPKRRAAHCDAWCFFHLPRATVGVPGRAVFSSGFLHVSIVVLLFQLPWLTAWFGFTDDQAPRRHSASYDLKKIDLSAYLPALRATGPGGKPGRGNDPEMPPALGSTAFHPKLTLVSNPRNPDNNRQTIIQSNSPPDLRIPFELRLPNVVLGNPMAPPKPELKLAAMQPRAPERKLASDVAAAPEVRRTEADLAMNLEPLPGATPKLPLPRLSVAPLSAAQGRQTGPRTGAGQESDEAAGEGGLLVLGVEPGPPSSVLTLPPGNRLGAFSLSPAGGQPGSPGGIVGGTVGGGTGGNGSGGDGSTGLGAGNSGGGADGAAVGSNSYPVSISGSTGNGSAVEGGEAEVSIQGNLVFPVLNAVRAPRNTLVVSTGPVGGGGLRVYGVLQGGRIDTIYLPMPGKNWIMQYCRVEDPHAKTSSERPSVSVQLQRAILAPEPLETFDFRRPALSEDQRRQFVILRGVLREDGTLHDLNVWQGVELKADELALAAFGRWKFRPAMQGGQPVAVEFLVGVPLSMAER